MYLKKTLCQRRLALLGTRSLQSLLIGFTSFAMDTLVALAMDQLKNLRASILFVNKMLYNFQKKILNT